jgi:putative DNA primase/helicase
MLDFNLASLQPEQEELPVVRAYNITTGVGKTRIAIEVFAEGIKQAKEKGQNHTTVYFVPTHRLGEDLVALFAEQGLKARVWYGRDNPVPGSPDRLMCNNMERVDLALKAGLSISETCCKQLGKSGWVLCPFYNVCAYQDQLRAEPDVWIMPHHSLLTQNPVIGKPAMIIIDETFYANGIVTSKKPIPVESIRRELIPPIGKEMLTADLDAYRNRLADALDKQGEGSLQRKHLIAAGVTAEMCSRANGLEWLLITGFGAFGPHSSNEEIAKFKAKIPTLRFHRRMSRLWVSARDLINMPNDDAVSGRIYVANEEGSRVVHLSGLKKIVKQWQTHTVIMDATLPGLPILQAYHRQVEIVRDLQVSMPHAYVRQAIYAPVSQKKLMGKGTDHNRKAIRRYVLKRWLETGRGPTLVICQQGYELWLRDSGLPDNVAIEHLNNVAGLDRYKAVRLLIVIGRTLPPPADVEAMAGALTGIEPKRAEMQANGSRWYKQELRGALTADGRTPGITCDVHPDPVCEAIRWRICEGELVQAIGRARGVNRTADDPVDIDVLADVCLPVTLNAIGIWREPSSLWESAAQGVVLTNRIDMVKCFPALRPNETAAKRALEELPEAMRSRTGSESLKEESGTQNRGPGHSSCESFPFIDFDPVLYQPAGKGMQKRHGFFISTLVPDARAWLEERLGLELVYFEKVET